jgi:RNA polymerase sigma factor (sigma-70 family)
MNSSESQEFNGGPLWEDPGTLKKLRGIVARLTRNETEREDLFQEAWTHLWKSQRDQPGQSRSWYLQSCQFHLKHHIVKGISIDAPKRRSFRLEFPLAADGAAARGSHAEAKMGMLKVIEEVMESLDTRERAVLRLLADEFTVREIAQKLHISARDVIRVRRKVASLANAAGILVSGE